MKIEERANEIISMYVEQNLNTVQIAEKIGCSNSGVISLLKRYGVDRTHTPNELTLSHADRGIICEMYEAGRTTEEVGQEFGLCGNTIAKVLKECGVGVRKAARRSGVKNHDYFERIDTADKAYFLGWMITDGAVVESKTRPNRSKIISIEIADRDRDILQLFAQRLGAEQDIVKDFKKRGHSHIRFSSEKMAEDLEKYGVVPRKSEIATLPIIDDTLMPHLIRGIFDGNGTATVGKDGCVRFAFYGSHALCSGIRDYLGSTIGLNMNKVSKTTCYHVWYGGNGVAKRFSEYLYADCGEYMLQRKKSKFDTIS